MAALALLFPPIRIEPVMLPMRDTVLASLEGQRPAFSQAKRDEKSKLFVPATGNKMLKDQPNAKKEWRE